MRALLRLQEVGASDVFFQPDYASFSAPEDGSTEALLYEESDEVLFMPIIRRPIPMENGLSDFETPYGYSGPLTTTSDEDFLTRGWDAFCEAGRRAGIVAGLVRFSPLLGNWNLFSRVPAEVVAKRETVVITGGKTLDSIVRAYPSGLRKRLARAQSQGVHVVKAGEESIDVFLSIYSRRMSELGADASYAVNKERLLALFSSQTLRTEMLLCLDPQGEAIGAVVTLGGDRFLHYHLSASLSQFRTLSPNDVMRHASIEQFVRSDYEALHFGGGITDALEDPLLAFKRKFSKEELIYRAGGVVFSPEDFELVTSRWMLRTPEEDRRSNKFLIYRG